jgi:hypothetical protein
MKQRRTLDHNNLVAEATTQVSATQSLSFRINNAKKGVEMVRAESAGHQESYRISH